MTVLLISLSSLVLVLIGIRLARGRASAIKSPDDLRSQFRAVDVDAFRNLVSVVEEEFLHAELPAGVYRRVQRQRLRALLAYMSCLAGNAAVLIRMGEQARRSPDPAVAEAGTKLVNNGLHLRLQTVEVRMKLYMQIVYPGLRTRSGDLAGQYEQVTRQGVLLGRMQYPARGVSGVL
jgi:hypothetical protein